MRKRVTYGCRYCMRGFTYPESDNREKYFCPVCGHEMCYWISEDIDETTGEVTKSYKDKIRSANSPESRKNGDEFDIQCPNCHNINTRKVRFIEKFVSIITLGTLFTKQPFKCKNCGYSWGKR